MRSMLSQLAACTSGCSSRSPQRITGQAQFGKNGQLNALTAQRLHSVSNFLLVGRNIPQMNGQTDGGNAAKPLGMMISPFAYSTLMSMVPCSSSSTVSRPSFSSALSMSLKRLKPSARSEKSG